MKSLSKFIAIILAVAVGAFFICTENVNASSVTKNRKPDCMFTWTATASDIMPVLQNMDNRMITVTATAKIGEKTKKTKFKVKPGKKKKGYIRWNLKTSKKQKISVKFEVSARDCDPISRTMNGSRKLGSNYIKMWEGKEKSLDNNFKAYAKGLGVDDNIELYAKAAQIARSKCKKGKGVDVSNNAGPRYRFDVKGCRIVLTKNGSTGKIVSFKTR